MLTQCRHNKLTASCSRPLPTSL